LGQIDPYSMLCPRNLHGGHNGLISDLFYTYKILFGLNAKICVWIYKSQQIFMLMERKGAQTAEVPPRFHDLNIIAPRRSWWIMHSSWLKHYSIASCGGKGRWRKIHHCALRIHRRSHNLILLKCCLNFMRPWVYAFCGAHCFCARQKMSKCLQKMIKKKESVSLKVMFEKFTDSRKTLF
jgi:hypothetical protein